MLLSVLVQHLQRLRPVGGTAVLPCLLELLLCLLC
jgi:hypothetical protein